MTDIAIPKDRRIRRTKQTIKSVFIDLLKDNPFNKITISQICKIADINRSTFYTHYEDIFHLLRDMKQDIFKDIEVLSVFMMENKSKNDDIMRSFLNFIHENKTMLKLFMVDNFDLAFNNTFIEKCIDLYRKMAIESSKGIIKNRDEFENTLLFLNYGYFALYRRWLETDCKEDINSIVKTAMSLSKRCFDYLASI